jgi:hypothetical protein
VIGPARGRRGGGGVGVEAEDIAIVSCATGRVGEDGIRLGYKGEVIGGVRVAAVGVGVVSFRECVEGFLDGGWRGIGADF